MDLVHTGLPSNCKISNVTCDSYFYCNESQIVIIKSKIDINITIQIFKIFFGLHQNSCGKDS